jgi:hypothetical protein
VTTEKTPQDNTDMLVLAIQRETVSNNSPHWLLLLKSQLARFGTVAAVETVQDRSMRFSGLAVNDASLG